MKKLVILVTLLVIFETSSAAFAQTRRGTPFTTNVTEGIVEMKDFFAHVYPAFEVTNDITLAEEDDSIVIELTDTTNPWEEYRICIYRSDGVEEALNIGPIKTDKFIITGLQGGEKYIVAISATSSTQLVSGKVYAAKNGSDVK